MFWLQALTLLGDECKAVVEWHPLTSVELFSFDRRHFENFLQSLRRMFRIWHNVHCEIWGWCFPFLFCHLILQQCMNILEYIYSRWLHMKTVKHASFSRTCCKNSNSLKSRHQPLKPPDVVSDFSLWKSLEGNFIISHIEFLWFSRGVSLTSLLTQSFKQLPLLLVGAPRLLQYVPSLLRGTRTASLCPALPPSSLCLSVCLCVSLSFAVLRGSLWNVICDPLLSARWDVCTRRPSTSPSAPSTWHSRSSRGSATRAVSKHSLAGWCRLVTEV